jgi:hypothetical protein
LLKLRLLVPRQSGDPSIHLLNSPNLAFPNHNDIPTLRAQFSADNFITFNICNKLFLPKVHTRFGRVTKFAPLMAMPKTSMNKDRSAMFNQNYVRLAEDVLPAIQAKTKSHLMQQAPHSTFWRRVARFNSRHVPASMFFGE